MDGLSVITYTTGDRLKFTTTYVGFDAISLTPPPPGYLPGYHACYPPPPPPPTGLFMTFEQGNTEALRAIADRKFNPANNPFPFTTFGIYWNGVLIIGIKVEKSPFSATICCIKNDENKYRLGRWTWINNDVFREKALKDERLPKLKINLYDTHTRRSVPIMVGISDVTYVNSPIYREPPWFCPIGANVTWLSNKPAIDMSELEWFIEGVLDRMVLPSPPPPAAEVAAPVVTVSAEEMAKAVKNIFGDYEYMKGELKKYSDAYIKLPVKDKECNAYGNLSESVIDLKSKRQAILAEQKYRVELLNRICKIILLMNNSEPLLRFYELWIEMMTKTMSSGVPNIPLFRTIDSRPRDFDDLGDITNDDDELTKAFRRAHARCWSSRSSAGSSYCRPEKKTGLPWWTATETYKSKYESIPIEDKNKLCRANTDEIKGKLNKLYHSTDIKEVKSLVNNKKLLLGVHPDHNIGCEGLSKTAFQELQELREYVVKLPPSAGGRRRSKRIRRKSRKVRTGRRKSRRNNRSTYRK
jgi:hypothetical protein